MQAIYRIEQTENTRCTLLGIGPMSANLIEATFTLAKAEDFPVMFIASRNQVDADELGGGYVCSWNQERFRRDIDAIAAKCNFDGLYYLCRDHGGPWQRDKERNDKLPADEAMELGKRSYLHDLRAGFDLLHIDPTKAPTDNGVVPMEMVLDYTVELIRYCEEKRRELDLPEVSYEVGTEETSGGLTSQDAYNYFINTLIARLEALQLPRPVFIVGQTGTLTRLTENVGKFNPDQAMTLSQTAREHGVGLKEHNADYLSPYVLTLHPAIGVTAANVAPEYGVVETKTLLMLSDIESYLAEKKRVASRSDFFSVFVNAAVASGRWRKWMVGEAADYDVKQVMADKELCHTVVEICGHYTFNNPEVIAETEKMYENLRNVGLNPRQVVIDAIMDSIGKYVDAFNMRGISTKARNALVGA